MAAVLACAAVKASHSLKMIYFEAAAFGTFELDSLTAPSYIVKLVILKLTRSVRIKSLLGLLVGQLPVETLFCFFFYLFDRHKEFISKKMVHILRPP